MEAAGLRSAPSGCSGANVPPASPCPCFSLPAVGESNGRSHGRRPGTALLSPLAFAELKGEVSVFPGKRDRPAGQTSLGAVSDVNPSAWEPPTPRFKAAQMPPPRGRPQPLPDRPRSQTKALSSDLPTCSVQASVDLRPLSTSTGHVNTLRTKGEGQDAWGEGTRASC